MQILFAVTKAELKSVPPPGYFIKFTKLLSGVYLWNETFDLSSKGITVNHELLLKSTLSAK